MQHLLYNSDQFYFNSVCDFYILKNIRTVWHISPKCTNTPKPKIPQGKNMVMTNPGGKNALIPPICTLFPCINMGKQLLPTIK